MAEFTFSNMKTKYGGFTAPIAVIRINGKNIRDAKNKLGVSDVEIEMSSGFEASLATFMIGNCYNKEKSQFDYEKVKDYICLGSAVQILLGYGNSVREVFRGFISGVDFEFERDSVPGIIVTAMDVKGLMMANNYSRQLKADCFSDAVEEILNKSEYARLKSELDIIVNKYIDATPDKDPLKEPGKESDRTIEMVCESDYEFIVKAAKKVNFEFFSIGGDFYFRKAKCNPEILMEISSATSIRRLHVRYDITGLLGGIEVRGVDVGKAKIISAAGKSQNKISSGNKAKPLVKDSAKVYIDPTITSKTEAEQRLGYLMEDMTYRMGTLEAELIGLPELIPGRFIQLTDVGTAVSNMFYITEVKHTLNDGGFITKITGKASKMQ